MWRHLKWKRRVRKHSPPDAVKEPHLLSTYIVQEFVEMDEVKSFDSLDAYLLNRIEEWEQENPRPDCPDNLPHRADPPKPIMVLAHHAEGYIAAYPTSPGSLQIKSHIQKSNKHTTLTFTREELDNLIEQLLTFQCDMDAHYDWNQSEAAQALHKWKTHRGMRLSEWKREYKKQSAEEGSE